MNNQLMVSVYMLTFKHELYIVQAIEGVLIQETNFEYELIIGDDCSPDKTEEIINNMISTHPKGNLVKYFRHKKNIGINSNFNFVVKQCKGKYIAICEGDDYWTDPLKLQKQVDFLESHSDVCVCFHDYMVLNGNTLLPSKFDAQSNQPVNLQNFFFSSYNESKYWVTQPLTAFFRSSSLEMSIFNQYKNFKDYHLFYHLLQSGKGYYMSDIMSVYRQHQKGVFTSLSKLARMEEDYKIKQDIYLVNDDINYRGYYEGAAALYLHELLKSKPLDLKKVNCLLNDFYKFSVLSFGLIILKFIYYGTITQFKKL
jgi:glycosyltransferase involved in cell wall biosynthesis